MQRAEPLHMLVFGAHPDDAEIGMGGTIAKHTQAGWRVGICDLTQAEMSSNGDVKTRKREASLASDKLGLAVRSNLALPDRGLSGTKEQIERLTREIRKHRPSIVMAPYWEDRHPDHVACSQLVQEAVFNAKLRHYLPGVPPHEVERTYFYFINDTFKADIAVDISAHFTAKMDALHCYRSQFEMSSDQHDTVRTVINQGYLDLVEARDRLLGKQLGVTYAEGFISKSPYFIDLFQE